jgi:hypothetical protein
VLGTSLAASGPENLVLGAVRVQLAGDPANPDWDGDGLPNEWEIACGLNPLSALGDDGAAGDPDQDRLPNAHEWLAGTNPRDAASVLRADLVSLASGRLRLGWRAVPGQRYQLEWSNHPLADFAAFPGADFPRTATGAAECYEWSPPPASAGFYRLRLLAP